MYDRRMAGKTALLLLLVAASCSANHMVVPPDIASSTEVVLVTDRSSFSGSLSDESFKLGPYSIGGVDRDWNSTQTTEMFGMATSRTGGGYAYRFKYGANDVPAGCVTESGGDATTLSFGLQVSSSFAKLGCTCSDGVKVVISADTNKRYIGELSTRKGSYQVTALYDADGQLANDEPTGYRIDGDSALGAVEVLRPGRAFFRKGLAQEEHADLACLFAGLMLYETPKEKN